jgi:hypothetical protein
MTTFQLFLLCVTGFYVVREVARASVQRASGAAEKAAPPPRVGHRVTVHTKQPDDQTIFGVLVGDYPDRISLEHAEYVTPTGGKPIAGRQDIATRDIAWIDVHALVTGGEVATLAPAPAPKAEAA